VKKKYYADVQYLNYFQVKVYGLHQELMLEQQLQAH